MKKRWSLCGNCMNHAFWCMFLFLRLKGFWLVGLTFTLSTVTGCCLIEVLPVILLSYATQSSSPVILASGRMNDFMCRSWHVEFMIIYGRTWWNKVTFWLHAAKPTNQHNMCTKCKKSVRKTFYVFWYKLLTADTDVLWCYAPVIVWWSLCEGTGEDASMVLGWAMLFSRV